MDDQVVLELIGLLLTSSLNSDYNGYIRFLMAKYFFDFRRFDS